MFEDESLLPPLTVAENISISLKDFASSEHAEKFGHIIANTVCTISRILDLERLDGITVAFNYEDALLQLDRGCQISRPLSRTSDGHNVGIAMAAAVLRTGVVKAHILLWAPTVLALESSSNEGFWPALYILAHECGHVEDLKLRDVCFPGTILQNQITDPEKVILERFVEVLWEEYAACRACAIFGKAQTAIIEKSFIEVLIDSRKRANAAILSYRFHRSIERVLEEACVPLCEPLRLAAYLFGHLDGLNTSLDDAPHARDLLSGSSYVSFINRLRDVLRGLWSNRGHWTSIDEFDPLRSIVRDLLEDCGIFLQLQADGSLYINIPYRS